MLSIDAQIDIRDKSVEELTKLIESRQLRLKELIQYQEELDGNHTYVPTVVRAILYNQDLMSKLFKSNAIDEDDLRYAFSRYQYTALMAAKNLFKDKLISTELLKSFIEQHETSQIDTKLFQQLMIENKFTFVELAQTYKPENFSVLIEKSGLFKWLAENKKITFEDLQWVMNEIVNEYNLRVLKAFVKNHHLAKSLLENLVLDAKLVDSFFEMYAKRSKWCKNRQLYNIFDCMMHRKAHSDLSDLVKINKSICKKNFSDSERKEIAELMNSSALIYNRILNIAENDLWSAFGSFEDLKLHLNKKERKSSLII